MTPAAWPLSPRRPAIAEEPPVGAADSVELAAEDQEPEQDVQAQISLQTVIACRNFSSAFSTALQSGTTRTATVLPVSAAQLAETFQAVDIDAVLDKDSAGRVLREAYGMERWLVGPERGVRALVAMCLQLYREPMSQCAGAVKQALLAAADAALLSLPGAAGDNRWQHGPVTSGEVDCPAWLRQAILARAQACIRGWHADTLRQLGLLLEAESLCPAAERFEQLKLKLAGLVEASAAELVAAAAPAPAPPATGGSMQALVAADQQQAGRGPPGDASWLMGSLLKMSRRGRWQRRFFMLPQGQPVLYYAKTAKADARTTLDLAGAAVVEGVLPLAGSASNDASDDSLTFHLQLAAPAAAGAGRRRVALTLRAASAGVKEAWVNELRAAAAGSKQGKHVPAAPADGSAGAGMLPALLRTASCASSNGVTDDSGAALQHAGGGGTATVPRKISTRVFAEHSLAEHASNPSTAEEAAAGCSLGGSGLHSLAGPEATAAELAHLAGGSNEDATAQRTSHDTALLADIDQMAAGRPLSAEESAVAAAVADAARGYIVEARARLLALTQRVVSAGMLLGRDEALRQALLDVLLPAGCRPAWVDAE